jgi:RNA polymerase sigma-70 factor (ECF subfamily)
MNNGAEARDEDLLRRLAAGDEGAFRTFYLRHQGPLYRYALHMTGRAEAAEEVIQESFMTVMRQARKYDPDRGVPAAFLFGIARNHVHRLLETEGRYLNLGEEEPETPAGQPFSSYGVEEGDLTDQLARAELTTQVRQAVLSLPEHYREVVTLCDLEEMGYEKAAAVLECPVGTVRSRLNRAREMLLGKLRVALGVTKAAAKVTAPTRVTGAR